MGGTSQALFHAEVGGSSGWSLSPSALPTLLKRPVAIGTLFRRGVFDAGEVALIPVAAAAGHLGEAITALLGGHVLQLLPQLILLLLGQVDLLARFERQGLFEFLVQCFPLLAAFVALFLGEVAPVAKSLKVTIE